MLIKPANMISAGTSAFFTTRNFADNNDTMSGLIAEKFNISRDNIYLPLQKHTSNIHVLGSDREPVVADAVITDRRDTYIGVIVADCVPVLLCEGKDGVIGAVHAGWRGTAQQILKNTISLMSRRFHILPENILVAIGPSIRGCSYDVGKGVQSEVLRATGKGDYYRKIGEKYYLDLSSANKMQALSMGVREHNIWQSEDCTFCNPHKYYSYRYSGKSTGRQGGFIGMW
jgi:YfiH family protein